MAHSYVSQLLHCVFSTKERRRIITPDLQLRLLPYMGGIARENKFRLLHAGEGRRSCSPVVVIIEGPFNFEGHSIDKGRLVEMGS